MIIDANTLEEGAVLQADVCVVGAGAAGITLALELAGGDRSVLLLESGGGEYEEATQALYEGEAVGVQDVALTSCRVRTFGGTTTRWEGWCRPLEPEDFEAREWLPGSGWPITRAELDPYYVRAQRTVQVGAFDYDAEGIAERGGEALLPFDPARASNVVYQYSPPTRFHQAYRSELESAEGLSVYLHANMVDVRLNEAGDAVGSVSCQTLSGTSFSAEAGVVVLAMGAIENARMLLHADSQVPGGIGNHADHLGRYFMEHPHFYRQALLLLRPDAPMAAYAGRKGRPTVDADTPEGAQVSTAFALGVPRQVRDAAQIQSLAATVSEVDLMANDRTSKPILASQAGALLGGAEGLRLFALDLRCEQRPLPESRVTLIDDRDALGLRRVRVDWRMHEEDLRAVSVTFAHISAELGRLGLGRAWIPTGEDGLFKPPVIRGGCHHLGTTRMSDTADDGVVDPDGRVWGVDNLYVAGSSVFRTGGFANPTLTIVALAHRLADHLNARG